MAFFTSQQLFGNGAGAPGGAGWVPIDTAAPPTFSANNRGIAFGEQLTSAIANRPHYALALNDDDINTRLALFETGGLDAAYDLGAAAVAGGGREVTKDAGAVETVSALASVYGDTVRDHAHFRANTMGDVVGASLGFDVTARRVGGDAQSGDDAFAGFLDRRILAKATGLTQIAVDAAGILNPGGALATTIRLSAGQFGSGGNTDLARSYDLVEIRDTASGVHDGIYIFSQLGGLNTDAVLETLAGGAPAFGANEACTVRVYRVRMGSFGGYTSRGRLFNNVMVGMPEGTSVLDLVPGINQTDTLDAGALRALRVMGRLGSGSTFEMLGVDFLGRQEYSLTRTSLIDEYDKNFRGGPYASRRLTQNAGDVGHIVTGYEDSNDNRYDFSALMPYGTPPGIAPDIDPAAAVTLTFTANSPLDGEVLFDAAQDADLPNYLFGGGALMVELTGTPTSGASDGLYFVEKHIIAGNQGFYLRKLDGALPTHFPVAGTGTLAGIFAASIVGRRKSFDNNSNLNATYGTVVTAYNQFVAGHEEDATAAVFWAPKGAGLDVQRAFIRCFSSQPVSTDQYSERFQIDALGTVRSRSGYYSGTGSESAPGFVIGTTSSNAEFWYETPRQRTRMIPLSAGHGAEDSASTDWTFTPSEPRYANAIALAPLLFPLDLPNGAEIVRIDVVVDPGAAYAPGDNMKIGVRKATPDFVTPAASTWAYDGGQTEASGGVIQTVPHTPSATITINNSLNTYEIEVLAGNGTGDRVHAVRVIYTDPGPRNF